MFARSALPRIALVVGFALGCGGTPRERLRDRTLDTTFGEARRRLFDLEADDPQRVVERDRLLEHLAARSSAVVRASDYEGAVELLGAMTSLLDPSDFDAGRVPPLLGPLARFISEQGGRRGDAARVLAAELILRRIEPDDPTHGEEYDRVQRWSLEARASDGSNLRDVLEGGLGLLQVWEEHARLTPAPEVLERVAQAYLSLRDALRPGDEAPSIRSLDDMEPFEVATALVQQAPIEAAAVFLTVGDLEAARALLSRDRNAGSDRVRAALDEALSNPDALSELAAVFAEARPRVTRGVCRRGMRSYPAEARFPLCLARVAATEQALGDVAAYYLRAIDLAPDEQRLYDEALMAMRDQLADGAFEVAPDVGEARTVARAATVLLQARSERFVGASPAPLTTSELHLGLARAEAVWGYPAEADAHFAAAVDHAEPGSSTDLAARAEFARLRLRVGDERGALPLVTEGRARARTEADMAMFEGLLEQALHRDQPSQSRQHGAAALRLLDTMAERGSALEQAERAVERARLARRLGDVATSDRLTRRALTLAPDPNIAAGLLQMLTRTHPDAELAREVLRRARVGSPISNEWKVYLALWTDAVQARARVERDDDTTRAFESEARRGGWHARLAALALGRASLEETLTAAEDPREVCQAYFHAAMAELRTGATATARAHLERALETRRVAQDEYAVARELLAEGAL